MTDAPAAVSLKVAATDRDRRVIQVRHGECAKDLTVMPSLRPLAILRPCWRLAPSGEWLFF